MATSGADFSRRRNVDGWVSPLLGLGLLLMAAACDGGGGRAGVLLERLTVDGGGATDAADSDGPTPAADGGAGTETDAASAADSGATPADSDAASADSDATPADSDAAPAADIDAATAADGGTSPGAEGDAATAPATDAGPAASTDSATPPPDATLPEADAAMHEHQVDAAMHEPDAAAADAGMHDHHPPSDADDDAGVDDPLSEAADEHCDVDMPPDPRDALIESSAPVIWTSENGKSKDVLLPQPVIDWMDEQQLQEAHGAWHATRVWDNQCGESNAPADDCEYAQDMIAENLWRAEYQQGGPGAGLAFLHMHRHMIHMFRTAFPEHADLFDGWTHVPRGTDDPENPTPWREITWFDGELLGFDILENIEDHLDEFPTEDDLGVFIESGVRWTPEDPVASLGLDGSGVHGAMHNQWAVGRSPANLGRTDKALPNYVFWKLHGFIDDVWSRYRLAKHLHDEDRAYKAFARYECRLMYFLAPSHRPEPPPPSDTQLKRRF